jgi:tRNA A37 threonylcarbamoyladenosine modification protein TsaB
MILVIDTSDSQKISLKLLLPDKNFDKTWVSPNSASEVLSDSVKKFLSEHKFQFKDIERVGVVAGPGHFSRIRAGVTAANAMAYALNVPVIGLKKGENPDYEAIISAKGSQTVLPIYDKEPNISQPKIKKLPI